MTAPQEKPGKRNFWLKQRVGELLKEAETTPEPEWLLEMEAEVDVWIKKIGELPLFKDAREKKLDPGELHRFHEQVGTALVFSFPSYVKSIAERVPSDSPLGLYEEMQHREESVHAKLWLRQAEAMEVPIENPSAIEMSERAQQVRTHLTDLSKVAPLAEAIAGVHFSVESVAAVLTSEIYPLLREIDSDLNGPGGYWLKIHAEKDYEHAKIARYLLVKEVGDNVELQQRVAQTAGKTHELTYNLYQDSYRKAA